MSALDLVTFGSMEKKTPPGWLDRVFGIRDKNNDSIEKANPYLNTRSGRPGIPSYDYSPAYTNRLWLSWCYWYEDEVTIYCDVLQKMRDEVTRYGFRWVPAFAKKCNICGLEHNGDVEECEECHSKNLREPDRSQRKIARVDQFNTIVDKANLNGQSLSDVLKGMLFHTLVTDNGYMLAHKEYRFDPDGTLRATPKEYFALDPRDVIKLFDFETGYPGKGRVCLDHRSSLLGEKDVICPQCGKPTFRAHYQVFTATKTSTYYIEGEICHFMYYYPSIIYGYPKCLKIKDELIAYHMIEKRVRNYYEFCKVPGILFIPTDDPEALQEMWQKARDDTKDDPFTPAVLGVSEMAPTNANFIKLMQDPNADLIAIKDELRQRIASVFGITLAFINDTQNSGGVKNDKNMIAQGDRTIRSLQEKIDEKVLRWITQSMGITDWRLICEPNISDNKLDKEQVTAAEINNAERLAAMGLKVVWKGDESPYANAAYTVGKGPLMSPEMMMMGMGPPGMGGAPGGGGMPPMGPPMGGPPMGAPPMPPAPQAGGVSMAPDQMGNLAPTPPQQPGMPALDMMAAGQAPAPQPMEQPAPNNYATAMDSLKDVLGTKKEIPKKKIVSTKLSNIINDLFLSEQERSMKIKEKEEKEAMEQSGGMSPMGGAPGGMPMGGDAGPGMGPMPTPLEPGATPPMPPTSPPNPPTPM